MKLYNSLTKKVEAFNTIKNNEVSMYVCGITPYDTTHMGHAFTYIFFDTLRRFLQYKNYTVLYTQNVTDIDDDILKKAKEANRDWQELGTFWTNRFLADMKALHVSSPTHYVKATDAIVEIIDIVQTLITKKHAYVVDGTVYFSVDTFKSYGALSHYTVQEMIELSKERGANPDDPQKKNPLDFIVWQKMKEGEPFWESPWGKGRPGWHIECSSMIRQTLGDQIDIHGGGFDLIYPHHESERAQSEAATGKKPFVRHWLHAAMVSYQGEKMSKSLGNLVLISDLIKTYSYASIRYLLLSHHYRTPWEFTMDELDKTVTHLEKIKKALSTLQKKGSTTSSQVKEKFVAYLENDMDTPSALNFLSQAVTKKDSVVSQADVQELLNLLGIEL